MAVLSASTQSASVARLTLLMLVLSSCISLSSAMSVPELLRRDPIADGIDLRVLPIGDSITFGSKDPNYNGYRLHLHETLADRGNKVDFVGGLENGTFADNQHEGHRGKRISEIADMSSVGIYAAPNIVLLHAGTNDMNQDYDVGGAPARLKSLIQLIYKHSPDAALFVCQIIPSTTPSIMSRIKDYNREVPGVVNGFLDQGKHIVLIKMDEAVAASDLADNLHPSVEGYQKMANSFYEAIEKADAKGWIQKAPKGEKPPPDATSPALCRATPSWYNVGIIAQGAKVAHGNGDFKPAWSSKGLVKKGTCSRGNLHFADLDGDGRKDYVCVDKSGKATAYMNRGGNQWEDAGTVATGASIGNGNAVLFADLNGDGRDDYIYVDDDTGDVHGWINQGQRDGVWLWQGLGKIAGNPDFRSEYIRMADIDGDGRYDFCQIDVFSGIVNGWLNRGSALKPDYHEIGTIATAASVGEDDVWYFGDFTGEGRSDFLIVGEGGKTRGLVNREDGESHVPRWLPDFTFAEGPDGAKQDEVRFADLNGNGKVDYLLVDKSGSVKLWENKGSGGSSQSGDGVILCDLDGDGAMDYFWVNDNGQGWGYLNVGKGEDYWNDLGEIAKGHHDRDMIRMSVLTRSGRADYVVLNEENGRAMWYRNLGASNGWRWGPAREIATGPKNTIETKYKWKFDARNVRFADLDGDGLDDYLYVNSNGAVVMWRNRGSDPPDWHPDTLVAAGPSVGVNGRDVQFADTNGDGKVDFVVVDPVSGRTRSWLNQGFRKDGSISWNVPLNFADGTNFPGKYITIADMTGDGRADYVAIKPENGALYLWHNRCWKIPQDPGDGNGGGGDGDEGKCDQDPEDPKSWVKSGAAAALDKYIVEHGHKINNADNDDRYFVMDDWLQKADNHFRDYKNSNLYCGDPTTAEKCGAPTADECPDFPPEWWYALNALTNVHALFQHAHHALVTRSIVDLSKVDQMGKDFDTDPPEESALTRVLSTISLVLGFASFAAGKAGAQIGADAFSILGTVMSVANTNFDPPASDADDISAVIAEAKAFIGDILDNTTKQLATSLEAFYGNGKTSDAEKVFYPLAGKQANNYQSFVGKMLSSGEIMAPISESKINERVQSGIDGLSSALLGRLLAALHYGVVLGWAYGNKDEQKKICALSEDSARLMSDGQCAYFIRRPKGRESSESVPKDVVDRLADYYGVSLDDLLKNVIECKNRQPNNDDGIYTGRDKYPPCHFGIGYIRGFDRPFTHPDNFDQDYPEWMLDGHDYWNKHVDNVCNIVEEGIICI